MLSAVISIPMSYFSLRHLNAIQGQKKSTRPQIEMLGHIFGSIRATDSFGTILQSGARALDARFC